MSRSMAPADPGLEPPDVEFNHPVSGRRFTVHRRDGQLWQRDVLTGVPGFGDIELADHPLKYVIGSGHFSRTYLAEIDGFLTEAPLTWFASTGQWGMSPGYDQAAHEGFARPAIERCVACHAGAVEPVEGTVQKLRIHETAIGCERCHGPGALHVETRKRQPASESGTPGSSDVDYTIVNPVHLSRDLSEAVCQQCHLTSSAEVMARGRRLSDYRPGLPLQEYLQFFRERVPEKSMKVVGHGDQLARSRCYQKSGTLTCITCHNPHATPSPEQRPTHYRAICLKCHDADECRTQPRFLDPQSRENDCTHCHMPVGPTEIIHLAFTHHRIGIHDRESSPENAATAEDTVEELEPLHDLSFLGDVDRLRSQGLAWYDHAALEAGPHVDLELQRAQKSLENVRGSGLRDGQVDAALAQIVRVAGDPRAPGFAAQALSDPLLAADPRSGAISILAHDHYAHGRTDEALEHVHDLLKMRRNSANWILLGNCELQRGDSAAAMAAFEQAVSVDPKLITVHQSLARLYALAGNEEKARRQLAIAVRMSEILKQPVPAPLPSR